MIKSKNQLQNFIKQNNAKSYTTQRNENLNNGWVDMRTSKVRGNH